MRFSIITPSFRSSHWLKLCIPSVADQGVDLEHIVQDAGSDDGTLDWLPQDPRVKVVVEKDRGMYDAVNRGLRRAQGDILAYLNCDEQYLPGALKSVEAYFQKNPAIEIVFGDVVIVDPQGNFLCYRKSLIPHKAHSLISGTLSILTCATFFRRSVIEKRGLYFSPDLRDLGDAHWLVDCIEQRVPMGLLPVYTTAFTDTGENMNLKPNAQQERKAMVASAPAWMKALKPAIIAQHRLRKMLAGGYQQAPFDYSIYTAAGPAQRTRITVDHPTGRFVRYVPPAPSTA